MYETKRNKYKLNLLSFSSKKKCVRTYILKYFFARSQRFKGSQCSPNAHSAAENFTMTLESESRLESAVDRRQVAIRKEATSTGRTIEDHSYTIQPPLPLCSSTARSPKTPENIREPEAIEDVSSEGSRPSTSSPPSTKAEGTSGSGDSDTIASPSPHSSPDMSVIPMYSMLNGWVVLTGHFQYSVTTFRGEVTHTPSPEPHTSVADSNHSDGSAGEPEKCDGEGDASLPTIVEQPSTKEAPESPEEPINKHGDNLLAEREQDMHGMSTTGGIEAEAEELVEGPHVNPAMEVESEVSLHALSGEDLDSVDEEEVKTRRSKKRKRNMKDVDCPSRFLDIEAEVSHDEEDDDDEEDLGMHS
jgi:hypothetical protein